MSKIYQNRNGVLTLVQDDSNFATKTEVGNCVDKSTNQTVGGVKTFSSLPKVPTANPTADAEVVSKKYLDTRLSAQESTLKTYASSTATTAAAPGVNAANLIVRSDKSDDAAAAHNCIYRGKNLTSVYTLAQLSTKVKAGDWSDLYIGDYFTYPFTYNGSTTNINFRIAHLNYWKYMGSVDTENGLAINGKKSNTFGEIKVNHILFVPDKYLFTDKMNTENTTEGGVRGSQLWTKLNTTVYSALNAANCMNGHIIGHSDGLSTEVATNISSNGGAGWNGATSQWKWCDEYVGLLSEPMVYGATVWSSSGYDNGCRKSQLALFRIDPTWVNSRGVHCDLWLGSVAASEFFCMAGLIGSARAWYASGTLGVRPFFLFS